MNPVAVADGPQAQRALQEAQEAGKPFRLILTDRHMPVMNGFELIEWVLKNTALSPAMIVMLTSAGHRRDAARCQELGVAAYLLKPIRQSELREALGRAAGRYEAPEARSTAEETQEPMSKLRVLLAEDNAVNRRLAMKLLEKRGHHVKAAVNGREALEAWEKERFDVILMDVQMPEMDGFEATAAIRIRERKTGQRQPIIAVTAHAMKGDREKCLKAGMDGYVTKPISITELEEVLSALLRTRETAELVEERKES